MTRPRPGVVIAGTGDGERANAREATPEIFKPPNQSERVQDLGEDGPGYLKAVVFVVWPHEDKTQEDGPGSLAEPGLALLYG